MTNLETKVQKCLDSLENEDNKYTKTLETLLMDGDIYELSVEDMIFNYDEIDKYCMNYAWKYMYGSDQELVLNLEGDPDIVGMSTTEAIETICEATIYNYLELAKYE